MRTPQQILETPEIELLCLAWWLKAQRTKTRIPYIIYPHTKENLLNPQVIANAFAEYYISLYNLTCDPATPQSSDCEIQTFLAQINLPTLSDTQLLSLNAPLTEAEINKIINSLPADKSPGPDSINKEYLKIFKNILTPFLLPVFNKAIKTTLPPLC